MSQNSRKRPARKPAAQLGLFEPLLESNSSPRQVKTFTTSARRPPAEYDPASIFSFVAPSDQEWEAFERLHPSRARDEATIARVPDPKRQIDALNRQLLEAAALDAREAG